MAVDLCTILVNGVHLLRIWTISILTNRNHSKL